MLTFPQVVFSKTFESHCRCGMYDCQLNMYKPCLVVGYKERMNQLEYANVDENF